MFKGFIQSMNKTLSKNKNTAVVLMGIIQVISEQLQPVNFAGTDSIMNFFLALFKFCK